MDSIFGLVAAAVFVGWLASGDKDKVPHPTSDWDDAVAQSIAKHANASIDHYNGALSRCKDELQRVKTEVECLGFSVELHSEADEINWNVNKINEIDVGSIADRINRILGE